MITTKKICLEDTQIKMRKGSKHVTIKFNKTQYKTAREKEEQKNYEIDRKQENGINKCFISKATLCVKELSSPIKKDIDWLNEF